jgi:hypothetical protein
VLARLHKLDALIKRNGSASTNLAMYAVGIGTKLHMLSFSLKASSGGVPHLKMCKLPVQHFVLTSSSLSMPALVQSLQTGTTMAAPCLAI